MNIEKNKLILSSIGIFGFILFIIGIIRNLGTNDYEDLIKNLNMPV